MKLSPIPEPHTDPNVTAALQKFLARIEAGIGVPVHAEQGIRVSDRRYEVPFKVAFEDTTPVHGVAVFVYRGQDYSLPRQDYSPYPMYAEMIRIRKQQGLVDPGKWEFMHEESGVR